MLAALQAENFNIPHAQNWALGAAVTSAEVLLWIVGIGAWLVGLGWIALLNRSRPSRTRFAVGLAAIGGMLIFLCAIPAVGVVKRTDPVWAVLVIAVPAASVGVAAWGIAWIALRWRIEDRTRCGGCGHALLSEQASCPECGTLRARLWGVRQARVFVVSILAIACACISLLAVAGIGALPLEWKARLTVGMRDGRVIAVAFIVAEATAVVRASAPESQERYGGNGIVRSIESAHARDFGPGVRSMRSVLPPEAPDVLDSFLPEARVAIASWIETTQARCAGEQMDFVDDVTAVDTWFEVLRPPLWATATSILVGPSTVIGFWFAARRSFRRRS